MYPTTYIRSGWAALSIRAPSAAIRRKAYTIAVLLAQQIELGRDVVGAPDDWGNLNPTPNWWYSGQASYYGALANLQTLFPLAHAEGIGVVTYGKGIYLGPDGYGRCGGAPNWYYESANTQPSFNR